MTTVRKPSPPLIRSVHDIPVQIPPTLRPISALSPLERAIIDQDPAAAKSLLLRGANPSAVCPELLQTARRSGGKEAECAELIQVATRLKRMQLDEDMPGPRAGSPARSTMTAASRTTSAAPFEGRFALVPASGSISNPAEPVTGALRKLDLPAARQAYSESSKRIETLFNPQTLKNISEQGTEEELDKYYEQVKLTSEEVMVGLLVLDNTKQLDKAHADGHLQDAMESDPSPGIKSALKRFSYVSTKPGRDSELNNNIQVAFTGMNEKIVCRHLAVKWLLDRPVLGNGKIDYSSLYSTLVSKQKLQKAFDPKERLLYQFYALTSTSRHIVENNKMGGFFVTQFHEMQFADSGTKPRRILIVSDSHAMACELRIKPGRDNQPVYMIRFYDPTVTASHRRLRTQELASIESLSIDRLINKKTRSDSYYKNQSLSFAVVIPEDIARPTHAELQEKNWLHTYDRQLSSRPLFDASDKPPAVSHASDLTTRNPINANYLTLLLRHDLDGELPRAFEQIKQLPDAQSQIDIVGARCSRGYSPISFAMSEGFAQTTGRFPDLLLKMTSLSSKQKCDILLKSMSDGVDTPLTIALAKGNYRCVSTFLYAILTSDELSPLEKCSVISPKDGQGMCFLKRAAQRHDWNSVYMYKFAIMRSNLPEDMAASLHEHVQLPPALQTALQSAIDSITRPAPSAPPAPQGAPRSV